MYTLAYRQWHERLCVEAPALVATVVPEAMRGAVVELVPYLTESFGNATRIDYGTGHETNFITWLYCLSRIGVFEPPDLPALVLRVFAAYMKLMRCLQGSAVDIHTNCQS